jgi:hypothetical protein
MPKKSRDSKAYKYEARMFKTVEFLRQNVKRFKIPVSSSNRVQVKPRVPLAPLSRFALPKKSKPEDFSSGNSDDIRVQRKKSGIPRSAGPLAFCKTV